MSFSHNSSHFTGKTKNPFKSKRKRVVREVQQPHKNKYQKFSKLN